MRYLFLAITLAFLVGCGNVKQAYEEGYEDARATLESETPQLSVDLFDTEAGKFVDQQVAVSGIVDHVCKHSGKRLKLVTDGGSVHVDSEVRFDDALVGNEVQLTGIVREQRIDESYCLQMDDDNTKKHREGATNEEQFNHQKMLIQQYRDSMAVAGVDHLSFYTLDFVSLEKDTEED